MKLNWKQIFDDYLMITLGCLVPAVSLNIFLAPNKISGGGVSSIGTVRASDGTAFIVINDSGSIYDA